MNYTLAHHEKVIAIVEIGLDRLQGNIENHKSYLIKQIIIANDLYPHVIIHFNNMNKIIIEIFEKYVKPKYGCVFHYFQPDIEALKYLIKYAFIFLFLE